MTGRAVAAAVLAVILAGVASGVSAATARPGGAPAISIRGGHFVNARGAVIRLHGVNRSGAEYACAEGWGIFDGATDTPGAIAALRSWNANAVRLPLNEDCWLGINGVRKQYRGRAYRGAIRRYVRHLNAAGIIVVLNLHFSAPGRTLPDDQAPMADQDHAPAFWASVARAFRGWRSVMFDLFNEPAPHGGHTATRADWRCIMFATGQRCAGSRYRVAGMQELLNVVRRAGARQPVLVAGPEYAGTLNRWPAFRVRDRLHQVAASVHIYGLPLDSPYRTSYRAALPPVAAKVPVVVGEFGDQDCAGGFSRAFLRWALAAGRNVSVMAWTWNITDCAHSLIRGSYAHPVPTRYGAAVRSAYRRLPRW